jgi:hypothetical protein
MSFRSERRTQGSLSAHSAVTIDTRMRVLREEPRAAAACLRSDGGHRYGGHRHGGQRDGGLGLACGQRIARAQGVVEQWRELGGRSSRKYLALAWMMGGGRGRHFNTKFCVLQSCSFLRARLMLSEGS